VCSSDLVSESNESEGVVKVTTTFLFTEGSTVGPVIAKSTGQFAGLKTISVTTLQDSDGQSIVHNNSNTVHQYNRMVDFTYPGVVSIGGDLISGSSSINLYSFNLEPPVQAKVKSRVSVIFQTSENIAASDFTFNDGVGGPANSLWNPTEWASTYMSGIAHDYAPFSETKGLRGYRINTTISGVTAAAGSGGTATTFKSFGATIFTSKSNNFVQKVSTLTAGSLKAAISGVGDGAGTNTIVNGKRIFASTPFKMEISGGPINPGGTKFTLDVDLRPAFSDVDGNTYYKKTIITASIPAQ